MLKRNTPLKSTGKLAKETRKQRRKRKEYQSAVPREDCYCCGRPSDCPHHLYPVGVAPHLYKEPLNIIWVCWLCHENAHHDGVDVFRFLVSTMEPERMEKLDKMAKRGPKDPMYGEVA